MTATHSKANTVGDPVSALIGRTDEGTPLSLADFEGRPLAIFFNGQQSNRLRDILLKNIKRRIDEFLEFGCSPIVITGDSVETLAALRKSEDFPFLMMSDSDQRIYHSMCGDNIHRAPGSFVANEDAIIAAAIPVMPPREQVSATLASLVRIITDSRES